MGIPADPFFMEVYGVLEELKTAKYIVGIKQLRKAVSEGKALKVFVAENADPHLTQPIIEKCADDKIPVEYVSTMVQLGQACKIDVAAAVAAIIK